MTSPRQAQALFERLLSELSEPSREALYACLDICKARKVGLFLVGGAVRDLLLGRSTLDLDLAIEGPTQPIAEALAWRLNGRQIVHERFGTASVLGPGFKLDLAQTRRETYARPGALPVVEPVMSIVDDLSRRDFTVNSIALRLTPPREILDPFDGVADLRARLVRVLHEASFRDDATRMLRAVRYTTRLGFELDAHTESWLRRDLQHVEAITGARLRRELSLNSQEATAPENALLAGSLGILHAIHPLLGVEEPVAARWREALAGEHHGHLDDLGYCLIAHLTSEDDVASLVRRLLLQGRSETALNDLVRLRELSAKLAVSLQDPVAVVDLLDGRTPAAVWALSLLDEGAAGTACARYLSEWRSVKPLLTGRDLIAMGLPAGERLGMVLTRLRHGRLRGEIRNKEGELRLAREEIEKDGAI
jgi:tRNA nucleotidyltransferase (CCA-adding enzyme)